MNNDGAFVNRVQVSKVQGVPGLLACIMAFLMDANFICLYPK